jgi:hypothetical protein
VYAGNNPIRYIEVRGEGPNDPNESSVVSIVGDGKGIQTLTQTNMSTSFTEKDGVRTYTQTSRSATTTITPKKGGGTVATYEGATESTSTWTESLDSETDVWQNNGDMSTSEQSQVQEQAGEFSDLSTWTNYAQDYSANSNNSSNLYNALRGAKTDLLWAGAGSTLPFIGSGLPFLNGVSTFFTRRSTQTALATFGLSSAPWATGMVVSSKLIDSKSIVLSAYSGQTQSKLNSGGEVGANRRNPKTGAVRAGHQMLYDYTIGTVKTLFNKL